MITIRVTEVNFSDGTCVSVPNEGTVLLVGPNNAGKSQALKDLIGQIRDIQFVGRALTSIELVKETDQPIEDWPKNTLLSSGGTVLGDIKSRVGGRCTLPISLASGIKLGSPH